jgi:hypothetical protein
MLAHELCLSTSALTTLTRQLRERPDRIVTVPAGWSRSPERLQWLVHAVEPMPGPQAPQVCVTATTGEFVQRLRAGLLHAHREASVLSLCLGIGPASGRLAGLAGVAGVTQSLRRIAVAGPGLLRLDAPDAVPLPTPGAEPERLSRTIGALGADAVARLRSLRVAVVGCGRSGSLVVEGLAALGVAGLVLIDPDVLEAHNFGEMAGLVADDLGDAKVQALARAVQRQPLATGTQVTAVAESVLSLAALGALKEADVLVCCADSVAARLATAVLAVFYLKPLLDIGTAVLAGPRIGADVRWLLPGRCLLCVGGLPDLAAARTALLQGRIQLRTGEFTTERLGSLRSLNTMAVGLGQTLLEQCVAGRREEATWLQLDVDATGLPRLASRRPGRASRCGLCVQTGQGDGALADLPALLARL